MCSVPRIPRTNSVQVSLDTEHFVEINMKLSAHHNMRIYMNRVKIFDMAIENRVREEVTGLENSRDECKIEKYLIPAVPCIAGANCFGSISNSI